MWPAWERLIRSVPVPPRDFTRVQERRQVREAESRRRTRCRARGLARTRTRARPCAPPRPALPRPGGRPPVDQPHIRRDLVSMLGSTHGRSRTLVPTSRRVGSCSRSRYRPKAGVEPSGGEPHPRPARFMPLPMRLGTHVLSHPPPVRARRSAARGQCGRAELALRQRCLRCRPGGAVARAKVLSWPQIG